MTDVLEPPATGAPAIPADDEMAVDSHFPFDVPYGWFLVAQSGELPVGEVLPRYYFGRHLVLWRDEEGQAHLQDAYCPHLGAHLAYGGKVKACAIQCPFHGWLFDGEGRNTEIPYGNRPNAKARIRSYPVREIAVAGDDHSAVTDAGKVLGREEAECDDVADGADDLPAVGCAE